MILTRLLSSAYDKTTVPGRGVAVPTFVHLHLQDMQGIDELHASLSADIVFDQTWTDARLAFGHLNCAAVNITVNSTRMHDIWTPNVCFSNSKSSMVKLN